ncbi:unnamed protein product, partial [Polarella glacialis]
MELLHHHSGRMHLQQQLQPTAEEVSAAEAWQDVSAAYSGHVTVLGDDVQLDDFETLDGNGGTLGNGTFGVVRRIRRKGSNEVYALKTMQKSEVISGNLVDQVEREIQTQRKLNHPNILRLYKHFQA